MVVVTLGSTQADFSRLLREVDRLVAVDLLRDVTAQTGWSRYRPVNYQAQPYLPWAELDGLLRQAEFVICHGGAATLNECLGLRKRVITVPRQAKFKESSDNHQFEIAEFLAQRHRVLLVRDIRHLERRVLEVKDWQPDFCVNPVPCTVVLKIRKYIERFVLGGDAL